MFAPPTAKGKSAELQRSTIVARRPSAPEVNPARMLPHGIGNQAMLRLLAHDAKVTPNEPGSPGKEADGRMTRFAAPSLPAPIQAKLKVGAVNDPLEHEADRVADEVMRTPDAEVSVATGPPQISRKCAACEEEEKLQRRPAGPEGASVEAPDMVHQVLRSTGQPLDRATRAYFEPRFGRDFSEVRVHVGDSAEQSAEEVSANAYTSGHNIVFGAGRFAPGTHEGRHLIAHELTHVVQQKSSHPQACIQADPKSPPPVQPDFQEEVLRELKRLPAKEEAARNDRLAVLFAKLHTQEADAIYERLRVRKKGDVLSERFYDILAPATRKNLLQVIGLRHVLATDIVPDPSDYCRPFSRREIDQGLDFDISNAMDRFINGDLRDFFGNEVAELYDTYQTSTAKNVTSRIFDDPTSELVQSFINHDATAKRQRELAAIIEKNLPGNCGFLPPNAWIDSQSKDAHFHTSALVPAKELTAGISFGGFTIPGIVAGGISGDTDTRTLSFKQMLLRRSEVGGTMTTGLRMKVQFHFEVKDAVDFCPGNPGTFLQQYITIPLSRLEASGMAFSVPFTVKYDGPVLEVDLGTDAINACK
jgi:hypothetical protein